MVVMYSLVAIISVIAGLGIGLFLLPEDKHPYRPIYTCMDLGYGAGKICIPETVIDPGVTPYALTLLSVVIGFSIAFLSISLDKKGKED